MAQGFNVTVEGLSGLIKAADAAGGETKKQVRNRLRKVGEIVRDDARQEFSSRSVRTAAGFGVSVRRAGLVTVEQRRRRTTGKRGDWGVIQMRKGLIPAADRNQERAVAEMEQAIDEVFELF